RPPSTTPMLHPQSQSGLLLARPVEGPTQTEPWMLIGALAVSYHRVSKFNSGTKGTFIRQTWSTEALVKQYQLDLREEFMFVDNGKSAIKRLQRKIGKLGYICRMLGFDPMNLLPLPEEEMPEQRLPKDVLIVLLIEDLDRMMREPYVTAFPLF